MANYKIIYSSQAQKDSKKLAQSNLKENCLRLIAILIENPYHSPPPYEKLVGDLKGFFSRRINAQHRLVYRVEENEKLIKILRMWSHYE